jgi:NSS family neurotransmitter:Na+ symporter
VAESRESLHGEWSGRWAFILAATGSAVGLGNVWKFPYITGEHGGGAFVLIYLLCIAVIGIPIMMAEVMLGRRGRRSPINTMRHLAAEEGRSPAWQLMGWGGLLAGTFILSFYSVIAGWAMAYFFRTAAGTFDGLTADGVGSIFTGLIGDPERLLAWHTLFMVMTTVVVARGVRGGLEQAVRFLMPALFVLLLVMVGYAMSAEYADELGQAPGDSPFMAGLNFLFVADFSKISGNGVLVALGHAFFTLSLGMGAIMVYGSYLPKNVSIARTSITIAVMDTLVALLAGMAIFPIVFANGLEPGAGPGLIFNTLPIAFGRMPGGVFFGSLFFLLLTFAAWTSAISLIEPVVAWLVENRGHSRTYAATLSGGVVWLLGVGSVFSFNIWSGEEYQLFGKTFFDILDYLTANIMLPLGGLLIALFAGWRVRRATCVDELALGTAPAFNLWYFVIRYISPVAVVLIFLKAIGVL